MKKLYTSILFVLFGFLAQNTSAQLVANDDVCNVNGSGFAMVGPNFFNVRTNDTYNGSPFSAGFVNLSQISTTSPNVNVSGGNVYVQPGTPPGTYTVVYQICQSSNLSNCDTATVTVNVCFVATPIVQTPTCQTSPTSLMISGLPAGSWTLSQKFNSSTVTTITGSGTTYNVNGLPSGGYQYSVADGSGCTSAYSTAVYLGYLNDGLDGTMTGTYVDFNSNGIIDIGDKITYAVCVINSLACQMTNVQPQQSSGVIFNGGGFSLSSGQTNCSSITASYLLTQNDINAGSVSNWIGIEGTSNGYQLYTKAFTTTDLSIPSGIRLNAFYDLNGNGVQEIDEDNFSECFFTYEMNNNGIVHNLYNPFPQMVWNILYETNPANTYDINLIFAGGDCTAQYIIPTTVYNDINVPQNSGITTINFPVTVVPCTDLGIHLYSYNGNPRPGLSYTQVIQYHNYGNQNIASGTITFNHDSTVTITNVSESVTPTATGFTFSFTNFGPNEDRYIFIDMLVPPLPTVSLGQWLYNSASITIPSGDENIANNSSELAQVISGSYDPNDKLENHGPQILFSDFSSDDYLTYSIRFENTGTGNADKVVITDLLESKLDATSIRYVNASHLFIADVVGNNLTVTFDNINLPPSVADTMIGKGFFIFTVKPKPGYAIGDIIHNTASIYFDTNPAIVTNTVDTEFVSELGNQQFTQNDIRVYPNPAKSTVNIDMDSGIIERISITDVSGKLILSQKPHSMNTTVDISNLAKGLYFVKVLSADKEKIVKVIKE